MSLEMIGIVLFISLITSVTVGLLIEVYVPKKRLANKVLVNGEEIKMKRVAQVVRESKGIVVFKTLENEKSIAVGNNGKEDKEN